MTFYRKNQIILIEKSKFSMKINHFYLKTCHTDFTSIIVIMKSKVFDVLVENWVIFEQKRSLLEFI